MKNFLLLTCLMVSGIYLFGQKDIKVEQDGEKINIFYKIDGTKSEQLYSVTISCKMGGKEKIVLKNVTGDVGENIKGGKKEYKAVWDVLKDVDELTEAEFFVKAVLTKDVKPEPEVKPVVTEKTKPEKPATDVIKERPWFVAYSGGLAHTFLGIRAGYLKNWGCIAEVRAGDGMSYTASATKRLLNNPKFKLNAYLGCGYGDWISVDTPYSYEVYDEWGNWQYTATGTSTEMKEAMEFDLGLIGVYKRLVFSAGVARVQSGEYISSDFTLGIGINF